VSDLITLRSHVGGRWAEPGGEPALLLNPATEEPLAHLAGGGVDRAAALDWARETGGPALRELSFGQRGELLAAMSAAIQAGREELIELAVANGGNTRSDAKFDIDGASFALTSYAELGKQLGDVRVLKDGPGDQLGRSPRFHGQHLLVPRRGVAVLINAFNFPAWGFGEKAAQALLAGMPLLLKPATSSALVAHRIAELLLEQQVLPPGALSLLCGGAGDLLEHLGPQDVVAFTGSGATGARIRAAGAIVRHSVRVNVEADSLNAAVLGPDAAPGSELYDYFVRDVAREITQKAGQKCTAVRRILAPRDHAAALRDALVDHLEGVVVGNPAEREVRMGPLATADQLADVRGGIERLAGEGRLATGGAGRIDGRGAPPGKGYFLAPTLLELEPGAEAPSVHSLEVFGPVATLVPYSGAAAEAAELAARGRGGLVASAYSDDAAFASELALGLAPWHGRVFLGSVKTAEQAPGPGAVLPLLLHGGPGRAGGGEELGGLRGLAFYLHRVALEGPRPLLERIAGA
jgi:oxepin-CoA hydrolase/3-oxo-5,6-dehydrosuberyl-CoA semialdehyde dehydrogenase